MDRESFIKIYYNFLSNSLSHKDIYNLLKCYCIEHEKPEIYIEKFINLVMSSSFLGFSIQTAVNYYDNKFSVTKILDKNNFILKIY
jgi:hypothetical protein